MNINAIDLNLLRVFAALWHEGNLSRAALRVNLSQPAMSNALARLRRSFDDPLFIRAEGGMTPTALAEQLAGPVTQALEILQQGLATPAPFDPPASDRVFRLVMSDVGQLVVLPRLEAQLQHLAPGLKLEVHPSPAEGLEAALASGALDIAIGNLKLDRVGIRTQALFEDHYTCILRRGHPLSSQPLTLTDFLQARHASSGSGNADRLLDAALARRRWRRRVVLHTGHYSATAAVVAQSELIATLPLNAIPPRPDLQQAPLPIALKAAVIRQFWHRRHDDEAGHRWLRNCIAQLEFG